MIASSKRQRTSRGDSGPDGRTFCRIVGEETGPDGKTDLLIEPMTDPRKREAAGKFYESALRLTFKTEFSCRAQFPSPQSSPTRGEEAPKTPLMLPPEGDTLVLQQRSRIPSPFTGEGQGEGVLNYIVPAKEVKNQRSSQPADMFGDGGGI